MQGEGWTGLFTEARRAAGGAAGWNTERALVVKHRVRCAGPVVLSPEERTSVGMVQASVPAGREEPSEALSPLPVFGRETGAQEEAPLSPL